VGNDKGIKTVFFGHFDRAPVAAQIVGNATTERHNSPKAICA